MNPFQKIYSKGLVGLSAAAFVLLPLNSTALASETAVPAKGEVLAALKLPPLPTLTENLLGAARKIYPSQEIEILPMIFLGGFGYPTFPGVSKTDGVSVFALLQQGDEVPVRFVTLAKLEADSPTRSALALPPYNFVFEDSGEWTLIARSAEDLKAVGDVADLIAINSDSSDFGLELRLYLNQGGRQFAKDFVTGMLSTTEGPMKSLLAGTDNVVAALLERYDWLGYGISANADKVSMGMVIKPKAGTADAAFINKALPVGEVNGAQYLSSDAIVGMVSRYDIAEGKKLLADYKSVFAHFGNEQLRTLSNEVIDSTIDVLNSSDGTTSGILSGFSGDNPNSLNISGGTYTTAQADAYYEQIVNKLMPQIIAMGAAASGGEVDAKDIPLKWEVRKDVAATASGEKISALVVVTPDVENPEKPSENITYYAGVKGYFVSGNDLEQLKEIADKVSKGEAVPSSLAKAFPLDAHTMGKGQIRTTEFAAEILKLVSSELGSDNADALKQIAALLKTKQINPVSLELKVRDGRLVYGMSLDSGSIGELVKLSNEIGALSGNDAE